MKYNDVLTECYIDSTLISILLRADVNHKFCCNEVAKEMKDGRFSDLFAVGIIDNDERQPSYAKEFVAICQTNNLTILKHNEKHHYLIKMGKPHKAMETFIIENVSAMGMKMEDFDLPSDVNALIDVTKNQISIQKDSRIRKLCKSLNQSPEVEKLINVLEYLVTNKYNADLEKVRTLVL